jgi:type IV pilus assembly protein PilA
MKMFRKDEGFTLVELMVVVLIIGILVAIAVPVFLNAQANAQAKSCQANQRTWVGALSTYNANQGTNLVIAADAQLGTGAMAPLFGTGTTAVIRTIPLCPLKSGTGTDAGKYWVQASDGTIISDTGAAETAPFTLNPTHQLGK